MVHVSVKVAYIFVYVNTVHVSLIYILMLPKEKLLLTCAEFMYFFRSSSSIQNVISQCYHDCQMCSTAYFSYMLHPRVITLNILQGTGEHEQITETQLHGVALSTVNDVVEDKWHSE